MTREQLIFEITNLWEQISDDENLPFFAEEMTIDELRAELEAMEAYADDLEII